MKLRADTVTQAVPPLGRPILLRATLMHSRRSSSTFSFFRLLRALLDPRDIQSAVAPHWEMTSIAVIDTLVRYVRVLGNLPYARSRPCHNTGHLPSKSARPSTESNGWATYYETDSSDAAPTGLAWGFA
jgi:hypothetical protein